MKLLLPLLFLAPGLRAADGDVADEIPYGIEVLTGYRSGYVDRGFRLSQDLLEVQLGGELVLDDRWALEFGGWYGTATASGGFDQSSGFLALRHDAEDWRAGYDLTYNSYRHGLFDDGFDTGPFIDWFPHDDWRLGATLRRDTGAGGWYGTLEGEWSRRTGRDAYLTLLTTLGAASDFYGRDGFNDLEVRAAWTYRINRHVTVTPFAGTSIGLESAATNTIFGGLWFAVNF